MKEVYQAIDILKGLQCIDGEYDVHRENELYKALRLLESFVEQKPVTQAATIPETSMAGLWADAAPVTVTIVNKSGVEEIPHESIETAMEELAKSMNEPTKMVQLKKRNPANFKPLKESTLEHPADRHQVKNAREFPPRGLSFEETVSWIAEKAKQP